MHVVAKVNIGNVSRGEKKEIEIENEKHRRFERQLGRGMKNEMNAFVVLEIYISSRELGPNYLNFGVIRRGNR